MKSFRDDLIDRMKTGWGRFVLASLESRFSLSTVYFIYRSSEKGAGFANMDRLNGREIEESTE
jgi:hypothetical protein